MLNNYDNLIASVADWMVRTAQAELTAKMEELVTLCDETLRTSAKLRETRVRLQQPHIAQYVDLPSDYGKMHSVEIVHTSGKRTPVNPASAQQMANYANDTSLGYAQWYMIDGTELEFKPVPPADSETQYLLRYYKNVKPLGPSQASNEILAAYPSLYLWGTLAEARIYVKDQSWGEIWQNRFDDRLARANASSAAEEHTGPMTRHAPQ